MYKLKVSDIRPINRGKIAPPTIIIINRDDALAVFSFKFAIEMVNILLHIIELNNPIAMIDHIPKSPLKTNAIINSAIATKEKKVKIFAQESLKIRSNKNCIGTKNKIG